MLVNKAFLSNAGATVRLPGFGVKPMVNDCAFG